MSAAAGTPAIAVVIPTRDRARMVAEAAAAVLGQRGVELELIVVDDGSTDDTREVLAATGDPRLLCLHRTAAGAAAARNAGAAVARAPFLTFLDSDDRPLPGWLAALVEGCTGTGAPVACCGAVKVDDAGRREVVLPADLGPVYGGYRGLFLAGTFALRSDLFHALGGYREHLASGHHSDLARRLTAHCTEMGWPVHALDRPLVEIRLHGGPRIRRDPAAVLRGAEQALAADGERLARSPRALANHCAVAGVSAARLGDHRKARRFFRRAIAARPTDPRHYLRLLIAGLPPLAARVWGRAAAPPAS